jgi:hypothetical protein
MKINPIIPAKIKFTILYVLKNINLTSHFHLTFQLLLGFAHP